ncbi:MAG: hypothetical protein AAF985_25905 [Bacteroidota bacterium]
MTKQLTLPLVLTFFVAFSMPLLSAQNVGIDEPNPSEKLDVNGRIAADGYKNTILLNETGGLIQLTGGTFAWDAVPGMTLSFDLTEATTVIVYYSIPISTPGPVYPEFIFTRLLIDNLTTAPCKEVAVSGGGNAFTCNGQQILELGAGTHTVSVQYRVTGGLTPLSVCSSGFDLRSLQVLIFGDTD